MSEPKQDPAGETHSQPQEMENMITSVWVKIEVPDESEPEEVVESPEQVEIEPDPVMLIRRETRQRRTKPNKQLKCDHCDYKTVYSNCLKNHKILHHEGKTIKCPHCPYTTKFENYLTRHMSAKHDIGDSETFNCDSCDYTTNFKWNLKSHKRKHKPDKQFKCHACEYRTAYKHNYQKHLRKHRTTSLVEFHCDKCPYIARSEGHILRHRANIHDEIAENMSICDLCGFATKLKWRLTIHKQRSKRREPLCCAYCNFQSFYQCQFKRHKVTHHFKEVHSIKEKVFNYAKMSNDVNEMVIIAKKAENIPGAQSSNALFTNDMANNTNVTNTALEKIEKFEEPQTSNALFTNDFANNTNDIKMVLEKTEKFEEPQSSNALFTNDMANNANGNNTVLENTEMFGVAQTSNSLFTNDLANNTNGRKTLGSRKLLMHDEPSIDWNSIPVLDSHDEAKPFKCLLCEYTSKYKASVQRHFQRLHTDKSKPYKCTNCDFRTKTKDQISLHNKRSFSEAVLQCKECEFVTIHKCQMVMHTKTHFGFRCTLCEYSCRHRHELTKHFAVLHLGTGLKCNFCNFTAGRKETIMNHQTVHTGIKPFRCGFCDYQCLRPSLLHGHMKKCHEGAVITVRVDGEAEEVKSDVKCDFYENDEFMESDLE